jgi:hypothetical protein
VQALRRSPQPVLLPDQAWEAGGALTPIAAHVAMESDELLLYYLVRSRGRPGLNALCLARSQDGTSWTKPDLGDGTNIVMRPAGPAMDWGEFMPTTILRDDATSDPAQRWKMIYWDRPEASSPPGICRASSPDGVTWFAHDVRPFITNANDAMSLVATPPGAESPLGPAAFYLYQQTWAYNPALPTARDNLKGMHRRISLWQAKAFDGPWVGPVTVLEPDAQDAPGLQFYWLTPWRTPHGYGGFLNCHHTEDQTMDVQWVTSRDGWTWFRAHDRRPILPLGPAGGFDCGLVIVAAPPVRWRDRAWVFYHGRATVHDGRRRHEDAPLPSPSRGIGLAEFPLELIEL